jgi:hypothetical protein
VRPVNVRKAYIRYREDLPESVNNFAALDGFRQLGVETAPVYGFGDIEELPDLGPEVCVHGFIVDVWAALTKLNIKRPEALDYPPELEGFLGRSIRRGVLGDIRGTLSPMFVKPMEQKVFTGFVWDASEASRRNIVTCADNVEIWISDTITFLSEYRSFIQDGVVLDVRRYKGDWSKAPDRSVVESAVETYKSAPRAYALDWGVTDKGETLLVEANDAYALGHYGLQSVLYARMIDARWEELTSSSHDD